MSRRDLLECLLMALTGALLAGLFLYFGSTL